MIPQSQSEEPLWKKDERKGWKELLKPLIPLINNKLYCLMI